MTYRKCENVRELLEESWGAVGKTHGNYQLHIFNTECNLLIFTLDICLSEIIYPSFLPEHLEEMYHCGT